MQRVEEYGLHGVRPAAVPVGRSVSPSVAEEARALLARQLTRSTPARTAAPAAARPAGRPPLEKRPAGAQLAERSGAGLLSRLASGDPVLYGALRRDPAVARRFRDQLDRAIAKLTSGSSC